MKLVMGISQHTICHSYHQIVKILLVRNCLICWIFSRLHSWGMHVQRHLYFTVVVFAAFSLLSKTTQIARILAKILEVLYFFSHVVAVHSSSNHSSLSPSSAHVSVTKRFSLAYAAVAYLPTPRPNHPQGPPLPVARGMLCRKSMWQAWVVPWFLLSGRPLRPSSTSWGWLLESQPNDLPMDMDMDRFSIWWRDFWWTPKMQVSSYHEYPAGGATSAVSFNFFVLPSEISSQGTWCQNQRPTSTLGRWSDG